MQTGESDSLRRLITGYLVQWQDCCLQNSRREFDSSGARLFPVLWCDSRFESGHRKVVCSSTAECQIVDLMMRVRLPPFQTFIQGPEGQPDRYSRPLIVWNKSEKQLPFRQRPSLGVMSTAACLSGECESGKSSSEKGFEKNTDTIQGHDRDGSESVGLNVFTYDTGCQNLRRNKAAP